MMNLQSEAKKNVNNKERLLDGFPIAVKDNINVQGFRTSAGTKALQDYLPESDAPVVKKLRAAGAIVVGNPNKYPRIISVTFLRSNYA